MSGLLVKDIMSKNAPAVTAGMDLTEVVDTLLRHNVTGLPVVADDGRVVGFVSEQDCLRTLLMSSYFCQGGAKVEEVMHRAPLTVAPDAQVVDIAGNMLRQQPKIYPVVDVEQVLVGLLLRRQVLAALKNARHQCALPPR